MPTLDSPERPGPTAEKKPCPTGIVLSGGGVRGVAHIGVLRALLEHGIEPRCVAGVSAGAIVGALYAAGYSPHEMLRFFQTVEPLHFTHFAFAKPGFMDTAKLIPLFAPFFPENSFEALPRKLAVLATDMLSGQPVIFDAGELIRPVLASASVPMIYSPTEINGRWYSDGGIADNFPAQLLAGSCERLLGVNVSPLRAVTHGELGSSLAVLERALDIGMFQQARAKFPLCDIVIQPEGLEGFGMFGTKHLQSIETAGYEAAMARMPEILSVVGPGPRDAPGR